MDLGFETIGNATLICHDGGPVLATDAWLRGAAYFGSWTLSHEVPARQLEDIARCPYVWISHGHPDHLSVESLEPWKATKQLLLPDHVGGRILRDLREQGFRVQVLRDGVWTQLSPRIRVLTVADYNQDAILLVDIGGRLVVDLNDASDCGWGGFVRNTIRRYPESYLMALSGYGDADMMNFFTEEGERIPPAAARRVPVGQCIARQTDLYGTRFFVPFSSMHKYQRADSIWADAYTTRLDDYARGFSSRRCELLPAFVRRDLAREALEPIAPRENGRQVRQPEEFGDDWSQTLESDETAEVTRYFQSFEHLGRHLDFVRLRVGGRDAVVSYHRRPRHGAGVTFEVPRASLLTAVRYQIFDDLLIGNFMKTTLHGKWGRQRLYPDFSPYVAKYGDNGRARTPAELRAYFRAYRRRDPAGYLRARFASRCLLPAQEVASRLLRRAFGPNSRVHSVAKEVYWAARRRML